jgi:N4-gp56 family major capsid protein
MAAPYTSLTSLSNLVQTAYDQYVRLALRSEPQFRAIADTKPVSQTQPGETVVFQIHADLAPAITPLTDDITDPAGVSLNNTTMITVTLNEYGNWTAYTKALEAYALDSALDTNVGNLIAYNMNDSVDAIVEAVLASSANVIAEQGGVLKTTGIVLNSIVATDTIKARDIRYAVAKLRAASVPTFNGYYVAYIHPQVATDLRTETGAAGWREVHNNVAPEEIMAGEIGIFEGVRFIETPRTNKVTNTAATPVDVYNTYVLGREALAEAVAKEFGVVVGGTITDPLKRKTPIGWYGIAGWTLFRPEALYVIKTASSIV